MSLVILVLAAAASTAMSQPPPDFSKERFVIKAMSILSGAQATYQATTGAGSYGTLPQLGKAGLIENALASGTKYGYQFAVTISQSGYAINALPIRYRKSGRWSYFIDQRGVLFGGDRQGQPTGPLDGVYVDTCALWGLDDNERCTISAMRTLHGAEMTYAATTGNGGYALIPQLAIANLIDMVLGTGAKHGYYFQIIVGPAPKPSFQIYARPITYGVTGRRSFFVDQTGVIRGADHGGQDSGPNDPPIN